MVGSNAPDVDPVPLTVRISRCPLGSRLILSGSPHEMSRPDEDELRTEVRALLDAHWDRERGYCVPNPMTYPHLWLWDSCFHAVVWAHLGDERAVVELESTLAGQLSRRSRAAHALRRRAAGHVSGPSGGDLVAGPTADVRPHDPGLAAEWYAGVRPDIGAGPSRTRVAVAEPSHGGGAAVHRPSLGGGQRPLAAVGRLGARDGRRPTTTAPRGRRGTRGSCGM